MQEDRIKNQGIFQETVSPLALHVRLALETFSEQLQKDFPNLNTRELLELLEEILKKNDINLEVSTEPLPLKPFLMVTKKPFSIQLHTRSNIYEIWPTLRKISGTV
ncbi:MAG: hypothetical protein ABWK01_09465 [Infirmifilum sp.]